MQLAESKSKSKIKIWLDCDPGHDDMLAIIMAANSQQCDLIGISTSAGNSTIQNTTQNALNILAQIDKSHIPVVKGSQNPLIGSLQTAPDIHGVSGLQGMEQTKLKISKKKAVTQKSFIFIYDEIMRQQGQINFVVTGANTNLALLLKVFPEIKTKIQKITIMGGAIGLGNWSPAAQFNILVDPEAASIIFESGIKVNVIPLEVTHKVFINEQIFTQFSKLKCQFGKKLVHLMRYFQVKYKQNQNFQFPVAHDPCTIYYLMHPQDFVGEDSYVEVQLQGKSRGRMNCQFFNLKGKNANAFVCKQMKVHKFWDKMLKCLNLIV